MSKLSKQILSILSLAGATFAARAQTAPAVPTVQGYIQPSVTYAFMGSGFKSTAGGEIAAGLAFGHNSIEADYIYIDTKASPFGFIKAKFEPILATYKYGLPVARNLTLHVGGSIGDTYETQSYAFFGSYTATSNAFTIGALVDLDFRLNDTFSAIAGVKGLHLNNSGLTSSGSIAVTELGLNIRF